MIVAEPPIKDKHEEMMRQFESAKEGRDPLEELMENWARWCRSGSSPEFKVKAGSVGQGFTHFGETDWQSHDIRNAKTVDAIVWHDLTPMERGSVNVTYLGGRWLWGVPIDTVLDRALGSIRGGCERKGLL